MKLSLGIVGLPNVGKSTLFKALTKSQVNIANYPFATIDPNVGVVSVPDERVIKLAELNKSKKVIPAIVEFYDIAGLVKGASRGAGLGNQFLSHIREVNAIVQVLRCFPASEIIHVEESVNPARDLEIVNAELIFKDLETVTKRLGSAESEAKSGKQDAIKEVEILKNIKVALERGEMLQNFAAELAVQNLSLLTSKAQIYLLNGKEEDVTENLKSKILNLESNYVVADLSSKDVDLTDLIKMAYKTLNLISFLTTGEDETRAWTIKEGTRAPQAAGVIHTDFEKKFIRTDVINWEKLLEVGGWSRARERGLIRTEGKEYVVKDGDVVEVKHG